MTKLPRRKLVKAGATIAAGAGGLAAAARLADRYGLLPPDRGGIYGPGKMLTYASHRLLGGDVWAREFDRSRISANPFANGRPLKDEEFDRMKADGFRDWRLTIDGLVERPLSLSVDELKAHPASSQITAVTCEEGWNYIAEWTGVSLPHLLRLAGASPEAKYVIYHSYEPGWSDSIDVTDATHPQTLVAYGMNGGELLVGHGAPLRLRVPRQLGYKSVKYLNRLTVTDRVDTTVGEYAWYAGI
jgi:DMSO/TMAO reductase YedYZ molybdopterin-dependent catalytic subunit